MQKTMTVSSPDPYTMPEGGTREPPVSFAARLKYLGPSIIISGSIVGSGEIILTSSLGAAAGFLLLWWVLLSCWIKSLVQAAEPIHHRVGGYLSPRACGLWIYRCQCWRNSCLYLFGVSKKGIRDTSDTIDRIQPGDSERKDGSEFCISMCGPHCSS